MSHRIYGASGVFETERNEKAREEAEAKPLLGGALRQQSYSTDAQAVATQIARTPATQYLSLNSRDRNQTSGTGQYARQPWNNFKLQRPQNIMNTFATRIVVSEINFPYYIPNVNQLTSDFWIGGLSSLGGVTIFHVSLNAGFYSTNVAGLNLDTVINDILTYAPGYTNFGSITPIFGSPAALLVSPPTLSVNSDNSFIWVSNFGSPFSLYYFQPNALIATNTPPIQQYYFNASLLLLMGMDYNNVTGQSITNGIQGDPTTLQYTQYIDIVSDKLHQHSTNRDGNTDNFFGRNLLCRLYISDEASNIVDGISTTSGNSTPIQFIPGVTGSFIIHRQFKNPKAVMWNKEASVDWLDISLYDQYGNLIPLPFAAADTVPRAFPAYPDFQITLLASEN